MFGTRKRLSKMGPRRVPLKDCKECSVKRVMKYQVPLREIICKAKDVPCKDCGQRYPSYVMDFDHLHDKKFVIGSYTFVTVEALLEEIAKCDVVCANCHRERTHRRKIESHAIP